MSAAHVDAHSRALALMSCVVAIPPACDNLKAVKRIEAWSRAGAPDKFGIAGTHPARSGWNAINEN
eukprot:8152912-Pyramimonas_sp.AAC.1